MEQIELFAMESSAERLKRREEIRNPLLLVRRTLPQTARLLSIAFVCAAIELATTRFFVGAHAEGEEIVALSVPLMLSYLVVRIIRTRISPAPEQEIKHLRKPELWEFLAGIFAVGMILLALLGASALIYAWVPIQWAVHAAKVGLELGCVAMTILAITIFLVSPQGRPLLRKILRVALAIRTGKWLLPHYGH
jgi:hypothetical protein